jgi:hypothetical protein
VKPGITPNQPQGSLLRKFVDLGFKSSFMAKKHYFFGNAWKLKMVILHIFSYTKKHLNFFTTLVA